MWIFIFPCAILGALVLAFASDNPKPPAMPLKERSKVPANTLTPEEKEHLVKLGTLAGGPGIVFSAVESGNVFDPAHMEQAKAMNRQWQEAQVLFAPYFEKMKRIDKEREQLRQMGERMGGKPRPASYKQLMAQVNYGKPEAGWFLRIEAGDEHVDLGLSPHDDVIWDCLFDAAESVPRFKAWLFCPEPVLIYEHKECAA